MFLICELNDEDYTEPVFRVCETKEKAFEESMKRLDDLAKKEGSELKVSYHGNRTRIDWQLKDWFVVVENLPFNESFGDYLLVWHHAYNGVDFSILGQGTYEECVKKRIAIIKRMFAKNDFSSGDNEDFDFETDTCIDTGEEWEMFDIVNVNANIIPKPEQKPKKAERTILITKNKGTQVVGFLTLGKEKSPSSLFRA